MRQGLVPKKVFFTSGAFGPHQGDAGIVRDGPAGRGHREVQPGDGQLHPAPEVRHHRQRFRPQGAVPGGSSSRSCRGIPPTSRAAAHRRVHRLRHPAGPQQELRYLSEHHSYGETEECAGQYAGRLAENMLFTWTKEKPEKTSTFHARQKWTRKATGQQLYLLPCSYYIW